MLCHLGAATGRPGGDQGRWRYDHEMDRPVPDPEKLLASWMEWERGETTPGEVMKNLKHGGLRDILEALAAEASEANAG